jgi:hypothetical protein
VDKFGERDTQQRIEDLNNYIGSKGKQYKSHYHTILNWKRMDEKRQQPHPRKSVLEMMDDD